MSALMLIKQAEIVNNNNGNGGISPLGATAIGLGTATATGTAMHLANKARMNEVQNSFKPVQTVANKQLDTMHNSALGKVNTTLGLTGDKTYENLNDLSKDHLDALRKDKSAFNSYNTWYKKSRTMNNLATAGNRGGFFHYLGKAVNLVK